MANFNAKVVLNECSKTAGFRSPTCEYVRKYDVPLRRLVVAGGRSGGAPHKSPALPIGWIGGSRVCEGEGAWALVIDASLQQVGKSVCTKGLGDSGKKSGVYGWSGKGGGGTVAIDSWEGD